jgi:hypothetical protein
MHYSPGDAPMESIMPTVKPRITITLTGEQHATLHELAEVQGVSMSSIVVDLVDTTLPVLQRLALVLRNASQAPQAVLDGLRATLESAEGRMAGHGEAVSSQLDLLVSLSGGGGVGSPAPAPPPKSRPPTSNRGVRNVPPALDKQSISPSKSRSSTNLNERAKK